MYLTVDNVDTDKRRVAINDPVCIKEIHHIDRDSRLFRIDKDEELTTTEAVASTTVLCRTFAS